MLPCCTIVGRFNFVGDLHYFNLISDSSRHKTSMCCCTIKNQPCMFRADFICNELVQCWCTEAGDLCMTYILC